MDLCPSQDPDQDAAAAASVPNPAPERTCVRVLHLRVGFARLTAPTPNWEVRQRAVCSDLSRRVLGDAQVQGLRLELWRAWRLDEDPNGQHWCAEWRTSAPLPVADDSVDRYARRVEEHFMTPMVGNDGVTKVHCFALSSQVCP